MERAAAHTATFLRIPEGSPIARLLGTQLRAGFEVLDSAPAYSLTLAGRHRFPRYMLTFELTDAADAATHLRAQTSALFPGARGQAYRTGHRRPISHRRHHPHTAIGPAAEPRTGAGLGCVRFSETSGGCLTH